MRGLPLLFSTMLLLGGCSDSCKNTVLTRSTSPGGKWDALMLERSCGATTDFSTEISVLKAGGAGLGGGNIFVGDNDHGVARPGRWGGPWAEIKWLSPTRLLVRYAAGSRVFLQSKAVGDVFVTNQIVGG